MAGRKSEKPRFSPDELEKQTERIAECLAAVRATVQRMREGSLEGIAVIRDGSFVRCYKAARSWSRSVVDGFDDALIGSSQDTIAKGTKRRKSKDATAKE
jgi:hypothetical protein